MLGLYVWHVASRRRRRRTTAPSADTARCSLRPSPCVPRVLAPPLAAVSSWCWSTMAPRSAGGRPRKQGGATAPCPRVDRRPQCERCRTLWRRPCSRCLLRPTRAISAHRRWWRTDRGVHATGQVAAVSICTALNDAELRRCLNTRLPEDVAVRSVNTVPSTFDPRRNARWKRYELPFVL